MRSLIVRLSYERALGRLKAPVTYAYGGMYGIILWQMHLACSQLDARYLKLVMGIAPLVFLLSFWTEFWVANRQHTKNVNRGWLSVLPMSPGDALMFRLYVLLEETLLTYGLMLPMVVSTFAVDADPAAVVVRALILLLVQALGAGVILLVDRGPGADPENMQGNASRRKALLRLPLQNEWGFFIRSSLLRFDTPFGSPFAWNILVVVPLVLLAFIFGLQPQKVPYSFAILTALAAAVFVLFELNEKLVLFRGSFFYLPMRRVGFFHPLYFLFLVMASICVAPAGISLVLKSGQYTPLAWLLASSWLMSILVWNISLAVPIRQEYLRKSLSLFGLSWVALLAFRQDLMGLLFTACLAIFLEFKTRRSFVA